jgi:predicted phage terminase large subunit-like protein
VRTVYGVGRAGVEAVSGFDAVYQDVKQELLGEMYVQKAHPGKGGKLMRAQMWLNLIQAGRVFMVKGLWNSHYLTELSMFPQGPHDDQIDATSICYQMLCKRQEKLMLA